jgi:arylsulfatase A-like enzyme
MGIAEKGFAMERRLPYRLHQDNPVYAGLMEQMDDAVGVVMDELKKLGLDKNTIVVFTGDNGGVVSGDNYSTNLAPLRGGKGYQWEGGIREPFFIKIPWMDIAGKKCDVPVSSVDLYPTLLELAGAKVPESMDIDGKSIVPLLKGGTIPERDLIWHYPHYGNQGGDPSSIIRRGKWKLIHYYETGEDELYDISADISEKNNVAAQHPDIVKDLHTRLFSYLESTGARYPFEDPEFDPKARAKHMEKVRTKTIQYLENQRKKMLSPDFNPGSNWWGSKMTRD